MAADLPARPDGPDHPDRPGGPSGPDGPDLADGADPAGRPGLADRPDRVRMALVGCGAIHELHLYGLTLSDAPIDVVAVVDLDADRAAAAAERVGAPPFTSLAAALDSVAIDAVDVLVPHGAHEAVAVDVLGAGKHLLLEKPMAPTLDACDRILRMAEDAGVVFLVAENAQYWPEVLAVRDLIAEGVIGTPITARATALIPPLPDFYGPDDAWRFDAVAAGGGVAIDTGSHWIRPLRMWFGEVDEVVAALGHPYGRMEGESLVRALLRFQSGLVASLDLVLADTPFAPESLFRVTGDRGELTIEADGTVRLTDATRRRGAEVARSGGYLDSYGGAFTDFAAAILHGTPPAASAETALGELRTAMACYRSAQSGRWEPVW